ncbi:holin family protein [Paracoccus sp. (in: a-proteobacteria)]|uniref:holin family protein n=1 Tax=Paracoccus sp. TaxID=267 RepID=UPI0026DFB1E6|nr:holin family protein [Paracoccus sp. (in: a-proteobacteria)]MDO5646383.1 holin family protein [Paracoccus sp. (in: a-proteobacteria)]
MGMISRIIGTAPTVTALGSAVTGVAEVFTANATRRMELDEQAYAHAMTQHGQEFMIAREGWFDIFVNGLNRLPRPMLALGTIGLFVYAMAEPTGFGLRMAGLHQVPEPLWWLLGAIVGFYFGAREAHHFRHRVAKTPEPAPEPEPVTPGDNFNDNAALRDWAASLRR